MRAQGFRGYGAGVEAVCGRTCAWFTGLSEATKATYRAARDQSGNPLR
jgi:hypothetical protein